MGEVVEGAAGLLGGGRARELAVRVERQLRRDEHEVPGGDAGRGGAEAAAAPCVDLIACLLMRPSVPRYGAKGHGGRAGSAQRSRILAARIAALRAPLMATQATGTPGGICTMLSSESRPPRSLVLMGTPITGRLV